MSAVSEMVNSTYQIVRRMQRVHCRSRAVVFANGCAFVNPKPMATDAERQEWAERWLKHYDTAARLEAQEASNDVS